MRHDRSQLAELERRRVFECRLTPDRALKTLRAAGAFLRERGMLTRMPDCALPSLFGACHEEPARPGGRGFDLWPKSKWIWSFQLSRSRGALLTKLHRGKSLYLSMETARLFDPLVREAIERATGDEAVLLDHLARSGPSVAEDVQLELRWDAKRLKSVRTRLERVGAVLCDGLVFEDLSAWFLAPMRRWDQVVPRSTGGGDPHVDVALAGIRAAVITPESELRSWFSWTVPSNTLDQLVRNGQLYRAAPNLLALGKQASGR